MPTEAVILGAGGHGKVVLDAVVSGGRTCRVVDQDPGRVGKTILGLTVEMLDPSISYPLLHVAIGDNMVRRKLRVALDAVVLEWLSVQHPRAVLSTSVSAGEGLFIAANAVVGPDVQLGALTIVNHGAVIDHDCEIGAYCHVAPNATLGGGVKLADGVLVGSGAVLLPGVQVGENAVIGSGAVVTHDVNARMTVLGVPAKEK